MFCELQIVHDREAFEIVLSKRVLNHLEAAPNFNNQILPTVICVLAQMS